MKSKKSELIKNVLFITVSVFLVAVLSFIYVTQIDKPTRESDKSSDYTYIINKQTRKVHKKSCGSAKLISEKNRKEYGGDLYSLIEEGYSLCKNCFN